MNIKNFTFLAVIIMLAIHFWVRFKVSEPYPGLVLPSFSSNGGNNDYYNFTKIDYTFYNTENDSLTVLPNAIFIGLHQRFAGHYTNLLWGRKKSKKGFTLEEERKLVKYLFYRGEEFWDFKKTVSHIIIRQNQFTYDRDNPAKILKSRTLEKWQINRPEQN